MSTSYRQARAEIVRVISSINWANERLTSSLNKLTQYQKKMKDFLKQLRDAQVSEKKAK
jgi:exonuclease VII small subunit